MAFLMQSDMENVGKTLSKWQAQLKLMLWAGSIAICLWILGLSDIFIQFGRLGRVASWLSLLALAGLAAWTILRTLSQKRTVLGVAATIEKAFPQLDNHLINYIQFGSAGDNDAFKKAYVRLGVPAWKQVDIARMKNRKAHLMANAAFAVALLLLAIPGVFTGRTWVVSLWRIVNPFSDALPVSFTQIVNVSPGDASFLQGSPVELTCSVRGRRGHHVWLDVKPSDNAKATYDLGRITQSDIQTNRYTVAKLTTSIEYRFRAGDSPFPKWYKIEARPPLAFTRIVLDVSPPTYTRLKPRTFDAMAEPVEIFQASEVNMTLTCNLPLTNATVLLKSEGPVTLAPGKDDRTWTCRTLVTAGNLMKFTANGKCGEQVDFPVNYELMPDREPVIRILSPQGRTTLPEGGKPSIQFAIQDDYGLTSVWIERVPAGVTKQTVGEVIEKWPCSEFAFSKDWQAGALAMGKGEPIVLRVVARDNYPVGERRTQSSTVVFYPVNVTNALQKEAVDLAAASVTLSKIIEMQRANIKDTEQLKQAVAEATAEQWGQASGIQAQIRELTGKLLANRSTPLGGMTETVRKLYTEDMRVVIATLKGVSDAKSDGKSKLAAAGLTLEQNILNKLTYAEIASEKSKTQKKTSGILALLQTLIKGETKVVNGTGDYIKKAAPVGKPLVEQQDHLADDTAAFVKTCRDEAKSVEVSDKALFASLSKVAGSCEEKAVKQDMLQASEKLDANTPDKALPLEQSALDKLKTLEEAMNQWQAAAASNRLEQIQEAMQETTNKLDKITKLTGKTVESMLLTEQNKDRSDKAMDLLEDEAKELKENVKDALLQVPTDLQIFPELSVANETVDQVVQGFEEVEQAKGSDKWGADKVKEQGLLKPESLVAMMNKAKSRMDAIDQFLDNKPDTTKVDSEAFDRNEMPAIALGALPTEAADLTGDLLKETEELKKAADDSATNQQVPDVAPGWKPQEGNLESFGAQGKSSNQTPDHKEAGGRGNMGRQGESSGESAATGGTIGEGDKNIEERITPDPLQSGQVQADGEADTKATGGGKLGSGSADGTGMGGGGKDRRMDSTAGGSLEGLKSLMAKTEATYVKASLMGLRSDSLATAAHHLAQAEDAVADGLPISQVREFERRAIVALKTAKTELGAGVSDSLKQDDRSNILEDVVDGGTDIVPANYRDLVSEYYKSLSETP